MFIAVKFSTVFRGVGITKIFVRGQDGSRQPISYVVNKNKTYGYALPTEEFYHDVYHVFHTILRQNYWKIHYKSSTEYYFGLEHNFRHSYKHQLRSPEISRNLVQYRSFYVHGSYRNALYKYESFNIAPKFMKLL